MPAGLGELKILTFNCDEERTSAIITQAVKNGLPFERFNGGIKIFA